MTYPSPFHLCCQHDHHRGALLPRHLPEVGASVGQRALARYVAVYQTGSRNLHLRRDGKRQTDAEMLGHGPRRLSFSFKAGWKARFVRAVSTLFNVTADRKFGKINTRNTDVMVACVMSGAKSKSLHIELCTSSKKNKVNIYIFMKDDYRKT